MRSFQDTFERLKTLLTGESEALRLGGATDLAANADAKARILLELTQWANASERGALSRDDVTLLVQMLNNNAQLLQRHMAAANRIAATLAQHLRDADSDGTYSADYGYSRNGHRI
jgi:hypothetical protein